MSTPLYQRLPVCNKTIRLIKVHPSAEEIYAQDAFDTTNTPRVIKCDMFCVALEEAPRYEALSYCWGNSPDRRPIIVNGIATEMTVSLDSALRQLSQGSDVRTFWVDALCIDQKNEVEKTTQVQMMRNIYTQAHNVVSWLGDATDRSDFGMDWLSSFGRRSLELDIGSKPELQLYYLLKEHEDGAKAKEGQKLQEFLDDLIYQVSVRNPLSEFTLKSLSDVFKRPFWQRIWIVQETTVARNVAFTCGTKEVDVDIFNFGVRVVRSLAQYLDFVKSRKSGDWEFQSEPIPYLRTGNAVNILKVRRAPTAPPLIYLLRMLRELKATDPRDKVFALLGIASDAHELDIQVDYTIPYQQVFVKVASALLVKGYFEVLSFCPLKPKLSGVPSWCPNWSPPPTKTYQIRVLLRGSKPAISVLEPEFSAYRPLRAKSVIEARPNHKATQKNGKLIVSAYQVGKIETVGKLPEKDSLISSWLKELDSLLRASRYKLNSDSDRRQVLWRVATVDQERARGGRRQRLTNETLKNIHEHLDHSTVAELTDEKLIKGGFRDLCEHIGVIVAGRRSWSLSSGYVGIGPCDAKVDDFVYILDGCDTPYILRASNVDSSYELIGEAYVHDIMDGQAIQESTKFAEIEIC